MESQKFAFGKYELTVVTGRGFYLMDTQTEEILVDGSQLNSHWPVAISISQATRDFYIDNSKYPNVFFGFTQGKVMGEKE